MLRSFRTRVARKLLVVIGAPSLLLALSGVVWLERETRQVAPGLWGAVLAFLLVLASVTAGLHLLAVRLLVERPLARTLDAVRRAERGDFLQRAPAETADEIGELARGFNRALAAITDLHARRIEDAQSLESLQREVALKDRLEQQHRLVDQANRELEARVRELTLLADLARTFNASLRLSDLLATITDRVGSSISCDAFALLVSDEGGKELEVQSTFGIVPDPAGVHVPFGDGPSGVAARQLRRVLVADVGGQPELALPPWAVGRSGSLLAVPMVHQGVCVGVLEFSRAAAAGFPELEIRFLESVADQAAMAVANARLHERTLALSLTDPLTGVHNRRSLFGRLEMELERSERFDHGCTIAMIDIDHFKGLNDRHGHLAGDRVLRQVAEVLGGALRKIDTLGRYGGEEFAVVLPRTDGAAALEVAEKLRRRVAATQFEHGETQPTGRLTISIGVASYPRDARELSTLVDCADAALFAAKGAGRDSAVAYRPALREDAAERRAGGALGATTG